MEVPSTPWREEDWRAEEAAAEAPLKADWTPLPGRVTHTFTHFHLELEVWRAVSEGSPVDGEWHGLAEIGNAGLPSVMMKILRHATKAP